MKLPPHSLRSACTTSTRAARIAGMAAAITAASSSTSADPATGNTPGTLSPPTSVPASCASQEPLAMPTGEQRGFIEDGDEIVFRGFCAKPGYPRIGFGECRAVMLPAG